MSMCVIQILTMLVTCTRMGKYLVGAISDECVVIETIIERVITGYNLLKKYADGFTKLNIFNGFTNLTYKFAVHFRK